MKYYRNIRTIKQERQISYQNNNEHSKEKESLVVLDQALLTIIDL